MREEILRMDRVTYQDGDVTELHQFCLDVYAGDILGLIPVNDTGLVSLLRLLQNREVTRVGGKSTTGAAG